jgi:hypothetical protein
MLPIREKIMAGTVAINLPKVWQDLLAIEKIPQDAPKGRDTKLDDPTPYCDDCREVESEGVTAKLCSGQTNYWLEWEILVDGEWHHFDEVEYEIPTGTEVFYPCGKNPVSVQVTLV